MFEEKKKQLLQLQTELGKRQRNLQKDFTKSHSSDSGEQAVERENDEVIEKLKFETELELIQIKQALLKISKEEYGICENCGSDINPKRLDAMPYSALCISCAEILG